MPNAERVQRSLNSFLTLSTVPYLFFNFSLFNTLSYMPAYYTWADWLQTASGVLIVFALVLVCTNRPRWGEWAVVLGAFAGGVTETVYLWTHRVGHSPPYTTYPMWLVIVHTVLTAVFGAAVTIALLLAVVTKDVDDGLTGDGAVSLPTDDEQLTTVPRDVIGGHRTVLYRWAGYIAALQTTFTAGLLLGQPPWPPVRTHEGLAAVIVGIMAAFFVVTCGAFAVMRGPWSTASQDSFYLRAKVALLVSVLFTAASAPFSFPRQHGYGNYPAVTTYIAWSLGVAGAVGVLLMLGVIIRFERRRGIALADDSDDATLVD